MKKILLLFVIFPLTLIAQDSTKVDLSNPQATIHTHIYFLQKENFEPAKAAKTIYGLPEKTAIDKAIKIKRVLDGKGLFIDFKKIPNQPDYNDTIGYTKSFKYILFPERMPQISVERIEDSWYYSSETIGAIDQIYSSVFPWYINTLQKSIPNSGHQSILGMELWQWIGIVLLLITAYILFVIVKRIAFRILQVLQKRITHSIDIEFDKVLKKLAHPLGLIAAILIIDKVFPSLQFSLEVNKWVFLVLNIFETVFWIYVFLKLVKVVMAIYASITEKTHAKLDDQLVPILNNILSGLVIVFGAFKVLHFFGVDTTTLLAGATIGGLAFALASQDTVKNLIGTITIFLDKPFRIGDWISAGEVTGAVEEVGFRSTRVRAADTTVFQIPNSKLSEMVINNSGLRTFRRYTTELGLRYDTPPELIQTFVEGVRKIILAHPETRKDAFHVEFVGFGASSLNIMVNVFFPSLDWSVEQASKHKLHMAILKLAAALGVEFAFPSTTVTIEQFPDKKDLLPKYNTEDEIMQKTVQDILDAFEAENKDNE
ncbi:MAG: mechanosensitive ion channel protein MscS [Flavobacteriaceae bacterium]|nr:mechanosensitive ion channel protein MscS [Flavobacteriaceae bacterium]|tara:strand:- start:39780 stop:41405 length:1626 start_codon:yes stop_codon:yes gene_type:complete